MTMQRHYVWRCQPTTVQQGRRANYDRGCGHYNIRASNQNLHQKKVRIQSRPCEKCEKRQRLNAGNTWEAPYEEAWDFHGSTPIQPNYEKRKEWAIQFAKEMNQAQVSKTGQNGHDLLTTSQEEVTTDV